MRKPLTIFPFIWAVSVVLFCLAGCSSPVPEEGETANLVETNTVLGTAPQADASAYPLPPPESTPLSYPGSETENPPPSSPGADPYPAPPTTVMAADLPILSMTEQLFFPITGGSVAVETPQSSQPNQPAATPTPIVMPTLDFRAIQTDLQANGKDLGFVKMGFHATLLEDRDTLDDWMNRLDQAGVPFFIKTVENAEPLFRAQELMKTSGVPHTLIYRSTGGEPYYELEPEQAAQVHWDEHKNMFPPELDPSLVWIETLNEPDRSKADWFGRFAQEVARLAMADGFRWAAFGWASGEPEPELWQTPSMLAFLKQAGENPDRLAIALHEYSYLKEDLAHDYPFKVGRFQELFRIVDEQGIPRPTVLITEWGWEYDNIPSPEHAMRDLQWASSLYAPYPEIKGAGIWNVGIGCCYGDISDQVIQIIEPLTNYSLTNYFEIPLPPEKQAIDPERYRP